MFEIVKYGLALLTLIVLVCGQLYWFLIHPWTSTWRRLGKRTTQMIVYPILMLATAAILFFQDFLLAISFPTNPILLVLGLVAYAVNWYLYMETRKQLKLKTLSGEKQLRGESDQDHLLTKGIYARVRNPRYLSAWFFLLSMALITNYLAVYLLFLLSLLGFYLVVRLEEKELRKRFGAAYEAYLCRVPRFVPKFRGNLE